MNSLDPDFLTKPLAHRGLHTGSAAPENSMAACQAAVAKGYGIEIDVQLSADGRAMVFHDDTLDRLTEQAGPVNLRTANELATLHLDGGNETIPTLAALLTMVAGRVPLLIEVKDQDHELGPNVGALERAVADDLRGYAGPVAVMSFNPHSVAALADAAPNVVRGLTTCDFAPASWPGIDHAHLAELAKIDMPHAMGVSFISHDRKDLSSARVAELRQGGLAILCWTIKSLEQEQIARQVAHNITFEGYEPDHANS